MPTLELLIGNKNYSSWSMRPWVLMTELGIPFTERALRFDFQPGSPFRQAVDAVSPAGQVPVLLLKGEAADGGDFAVWDSLAIVEALAERFPEAGVWPADARARARARSNVCEMHAGFGALRSACPMNIEAALPEVGREQWASNEGLRANVARIEAMWADALATHGGPFLFGARFTAADAFYAPVAMRFLTYGLPLSDTARGYVERLCATASVSRWMAEARAEHHWVPEDEPYRSRP